MARHNVQGGVNERRKGALSRLQAQKVAGIKPEKNLHPLTAATTGGDPIPLDEKDFKRIDKEIATLKARITA